jgi:hypothetical protein
VGTAVGAGVVAIVGLSVGAADGADVVAIVGLVVGPAVGAGVVAIVGTRVDDTAATVGRLVGAGVEKEEGFKSAQHRVN